MDAELKQYLEGMETRLRADASQTEARLTSKFETKLETRLAETEVRLMTHTSQECEKVETKLLTEFFKWGRTSDMRTRQALADAASIGERMLILEDRVTSLERTVRLPPEADAA